MWPGRERAAQRRAAQRAGVCVVGASATSWGLEVQARILGGWRRTGSWKKIDTTSWHSSRHTSPRNAIYFPTPPHSNPPSIQANPPSRLPAHPPESLHLDDHCQCLTTCKSHCITTHHNTPCFVNATRTCFVYVCLPALLCPCAFFGCALLACMGHLIFSFPARTLLLPCDMCVCVRGCECGCGCVRVCAK